MIYRVIIPMVPRPQDRPRLATIAGHARAYKTKGSYQWEAAVAFYLDQVLPPSVLTGAVRVDVCCVYHRPAYMSKPSKKTGGLLGGYSGGREWKTDRPDLDNDLKSVFDAMKARWRDDCQWCLGVVAKVYAALGEMPHVEVVIRQDLGDPRETWERWTA